MWLYFNWALIRSLLKFTTRPCYRYFRFLHQTWNFFSIQTFKSVNFSEKIDFDKVQFHVILLFYKGNFHDDIFSRGAFPYDEPVGGKTYLVCTKRRQCKVMWCNGGGGRSADWTVRRISAREATSSLRFLKRATPLSHLPMSRVRIGMISKASFSAKIYKCFWEETEKRAL